MSQEQRDDRAAFVARTNSQLAQAAACSGAGTPQQTVSGAGQEASSAEATLLVRKRRLMAMKMHELRPLCRQEGVPMYGTKKVIVQRLLDATKPILPK